MITLLSGGTGAPKLLQGLMQIVPSEDICVIVNTAEDLWLPHGYLSPDIDTVMYTLAGLVNEETWYGVADDTFDEHERLREAGEEILRIGDRDRKTHVRRGELLRGGKSLTEATDIQRKELGVSSKVFPMSDNAVETVICTPVGNLNLHEYLIEHRDEKINEIYFRGIETARVTKEAAEALAKAEKIIIGPSNPISSILPIISLDGIDIDRRKCVAVSPIVGGRPVSGPADRFMQAMGYSGDARGVAEVYRDVIHTLMVDSTENDISVEGMEIMKTSTIMKTADDKRKLAEFILEIGEGK